MFDSINTVLDGIRSAARSAILRITAPAMTPSPTYASLRSQMLHHSIWTIWNKMYEATQPYISISVGTATSTSTPPDVNDGLFAISVSQTLHQVVNLRLYTELIANVEDVCQRNIASIDDCSTSVRRIKELCDEYAKDSYLQLWNLRSSIPDDTSLRDHIYNDGHHAQVADIKYWLEHSTLPRTGTDPVFDRFAFSLYQLSQTLKTRGLDRSLVRMILNQGPGSCGMYFHTELAFLHMVPLFPGRLEADLPRFFKRHDATFFDDEGISGDVDDQYQQHLEDRFRRQFVRPTPLTNFHSSLFRSQATTPIATRSPSPTRTHSDQRSTRGTRSEGSRGRRSNRRHSTNASSTPPGPSPAPTQATPQVPDDQHYEPDPLLARHAREITEFVRSLPTSDMTNDHMTRFSVDSESPQATSRDFLLPTDQRIVIRDRYGNHTYLVTYTRKNRKPIFSPVN